MITGAGDRAFCAGSDLKNILETGDEYTPAKGFTGLTNLLDLAKPVIAQVNGIAIGGGFKTVLPADPVVATEHMSFGFPELRVGLAATGGGGVQRFTRQIQLKQALYLRLTGRVFGATDALALALGIINEIVPEESLTAATNRLVPQPWRACRLRSGRPNRRRSMASPCPLPRPWPRAIRRLTRWRLAPARARAHWPSPRNINPIGPGSK